MEIVTSHWKEDLTWLLKSPWPVNLVDKEGADPSPLVPKYIIPNKGFEASAYIKYIIERYDTLPEHIAFIHGHEKSWHQNHEYGILDLIKHARTDKYHFIPLNNFSRNYYFIDESGPLYPHGQRLLTLWDLIGFREDDRPEPGSHIKFDAGAQFIVSKRRVHRYSREDWIKFYNVLLSIKKAGGFFEIVWHILFGEPKKLEYKKDWFSVETKDPICWNLAHSQPFTRD